MNAQLLRDAICQELDGIFKDRRYSSTHGDVAPRIYQQLVPLKDSGTEDDLLPYIIVRVNGGKVEGPRSAHIVSVTFICGVYDERESNEGFHAVEEMLQDIAFHFAQNPLFGGGRFRYAYPFEWLNQEEESYPYYFGAGTCSFEVTPPIYTKASVYT